MMSFQRVWSHIGSSTVKASQAEQDDLESVTSASTERPTGSNTENLDAESIATPPVPPWMREICPSGSTRHSRASSIVSTRTKYSTLTLPDDARSIDIHVGGQTFRIARDGSQISDAPPPPYSGHVEVQVLQDGRPRASSVNSRNLGNPRTSGLSFRGGRPGGSSVFDHFYGESEDEQTDQGAETPRQHSRATSPLPRAQATILDPSEVDMPSPVDDNSERLSVTNDESEAPSRNWSYKAGPDVIRVPSEARRLRTVSQNDLPILNSRLSPPLARRNGVRLPTLITESLDNVHRPGVSAESRSIHTRGHRLSPITRSAGPVLYTDHEGDGSLSPTFIGRDARGIFPPQNVGRKPVLRSTNSVAAPERARLEHDHNDNDDMHMPLPMDNENDISLHYARLMRKLDRDHRKALHLKDKELEKLRERLSEMDVVYRQELKFRDFVIEDLKKRLDHLQDESEIMVEKACNEVEDLWESRWKTQSSKLTERMRRMEEEVQKSADIWPEARN